MDAGMSACYDPVLRLAIQHGMVQLDRPAAAFSISNHNQAAARRTTS